MKTGSALSRLTLFRDVVFDKPGRKFRKKLTIAVMATSLALNAMFFYQMAHAPRKVMKLRSKSLYSTTTIKKKPRMKHQIAKGKKHNEKTLASNRPRYKIPSSYTRKKSR